MNEFRYKNEHDELHKLIERYFEGMTTLGEEARLRSLLVNPAYRSAEADEARAVMGLFACARRNEAPLAAKSAGKRVGRRRSSVWVAISAAASVAIIICAALSLTKSTVGDIPERSSMAQLAGMRYGHDSIAQLMDDTGTPGHVNARRTVAGCASGVRHLDDPDEVAALISSEMGYMAEAERSIYESVADDFCTISGVLQ